MSSPYYSEFRAMGCRVEVQLETDMDGDALMKNLPTQLEQYESILSRFRSSSELSHLNRHAGEWIQVSDILFEMIKHAKHGARRTDGLYNPLVLNQMIANGYRDSFENVHNPVVTDIHSVQRWQDIGLRPITNEVYIPVGSAVDLGGIAKGWVAGQIAKQLAQVGACLVNIGGDITMSGAPSGQLGWQIEIDDPFTGNALMTLSLKNTTIITSGIDYRKWTTADGANRHHIIDPNTGYPAETDILTVTIIHPHAATAEVFAKAVMLKGSVEGLAWLQSRWRTKALVVRQDGCVMATTNFQSLVTPNLESKSSL